MDELITAALRGVDPDDPGAIWQIYRNLMALLPWWELFWITMFCVGVGMGIAWYRGGSIVRSVFWALLLGPFGWLVSWYQMPTAQPCPRCGTEVAAGRTRCMHCGCSLPHAPKRASRR